MLVLPADGKSGGHRRLVFGFTRADDSEGVTTATFQWSNELVIWNNVAIGATSSVPDDDDVTVDVAESGVSADEITVTAPVSRAVGGKLFSRLHATRP